MGFREITLNLPTDYTEEELKDRIKKNLGVRDFFHQIENKSLDARKKDNIHWKIRVSVISEQISGENPVQHHPLEIPYKKRNKKAVVAGSGPAGFFSAFVLQKAGFSTTIIERGSEVRKRAEGVMAFETTGLFNPACNYAFGEGGAGTFSDGKLTSRTKRISKEKLFIISRYIDAGAPGEIAYLRHPHLGSDRLKKIVGNLRKEFLNIGGTVLFDTILNDLKIEDEKVTEALTDSGGMEGDFFLIASGHSAYETYRMMMRRGVRFRTKNFALGSRVEHEQQVINRAQWGRESLPGVKAAEYRLTSRGDGNLPVYTFCMCPGGNVVPSTAYRNANTVNGMSRYRRDGRFANAACVAAVDLEMLKGRKISAAEALDWLEALEESFYNYSDGYKAPYCGISDFINKKEPFSSAESSYPLGLKTSALWELMPYKISASIREGLKEFCRKIRGFETGIIMGLESKTSSPVQAVREKDMRCSGFKNLYMIGEGSGYAGGIISSGADGIKAAVKIIESAG